MSNPGQACNFCIQTSTFEVPMWPHSAFADYEWPSFSEAPVTLY